MELRAWSENSAGAKACLIAAGYAGVTLVEVVDEAAAAEVVLQPGGGSASDGGVKGLEAVLR